MTSVVTCSMSTKRTGSRDGTSGIASVTGRSTKVVVQLSSTLIFAETTDRGSEFLITMVRIFLSR